MNDLHERFGPLRDLTPGDEEIAAVLAVRRRPPRRRRRLALGLATATAAAAVAIAALPGSRERDEAPLTPVGMLRAAAAVAADQPAPSAFTGYRYTEVLERWRWTLPGNRPAAAVQQRLENWVDRSWKGRVVAHPGKILSGEPPEHTVQPDERDFVYGDGPLLDLDISALPTEPRALLRALEDNFLSMEFAAKPRRDEIGYHVIRSTLLLLGTANTTPRLRSALWGVLALMPGLQAAPNARDPLGREGEAVILRAAIMPGAPAETFTVVFDRGTSELLSWSLDSTGWGSPDQTHTFLRAAHVRQVGDRPQ